MRCRSVHHLARTIARRTVAFMQLVATGASAAWSVSRAAFNGSCANRSRSVGGSRRAKAIVQPIATPSPSAPKNTARGFGLMQSLAANTERSTRPGID